MSLIDRSFEEVCAIMDRTGDVVDLLVEHATDFRMCDLLDENQPPPQPPSTGPRKSGDGPVGLGLVPGKQWEGMGTRVIWDLPRGSTLSLQTRNRQKSRLRPRLDESYRRRRYKRTY